MKNLGFRVFAGVIFALAAISAVVSQAQDRPKTGKRAEFMRQKLELSKNILEGLAVEDFGMIQKNAKGLKLLSQAAEWEVPYIPNVDQYLPYTLDFQRTADDLAKKAKDRNLDGATLAFNRITMSCVDCHEYVRTVPK